MTGFIDGMTDILRELYAEPTAEILRNENSDGLFVRTTNSDLLGTTLRLRDIFRAYNNADNIWNTPVILGLEHGVTFATTHGFSPLSNEVDKEIQFDEEWV